MNCLRKIISLIIFGVVFINAQGGTTRDSWNYRLSQLNGSYYAYDDNGNMTADGRQGLEMEYNVLNLPRRIEDAQTGVGVSYSYLADGTKAEMRRDDGTGLAYAGDMVFTRSANGAYTFESAAYCNGRLLSDGSTQKFVTDHLGSVRAVVTGGQVVERNDYYPLGMRHPNPSNTQLTANRYGYNGKERQDIATSGTYLDYGARFLDPVLGRWTTCDPMAEKYLSLTPYNFCGNDPINYVDPDGQIFDILWDAANVVMDVQSMVSNIKGKDYLSAAVDAGGLVLDAAAALVPGVPGGVGTAMKTVRNGDCVTDVSKVVKKITPNYGKSKPHGKKPHDNFIDSMIKKFPEGSDDIRKNQKQVDYNGNTVGNNRPDWQYNYDGKHYCGEVDNVPANNRKHEMVIKRNDPESIFEGHILK